MSITNLIAIRNKVRRLTGSISQSQLSDADLDDYINTFYLLDFPAHLKLWNLNENYEFFTVPNEDQYTLPINPTFDANNNQFPSFQGILPPVYIDGYESWYSQSQKEFYVTYPKLNFEQTGPSGDGSSGPYTVTLTNIPILKRELTISAVDVNGVTQILKDDGNGNLINASASVAVPVTTGTVNYVTGAVNILNFRDATDTQIAIPATSTITLRYVPYQASRPIAMLFFDDQMILRPVPDKVYRVQIEVFKTPTQLIATTDQPEIHQWWQLIAFGAARKVLQDRLDNEALASIEPFYQEQMSLVLYRTALQQTPQRTATIYTDMISYPVGNRPFGGF